MNKFIRQDSIEMEAELELMGHPNFFQSTPQVSSMEWDLLQTLHPLTLFFTQVKTGNAGVWVSAVAEITNDVEDTRQLLHNLATVARNVAPTTHATCLLMPSQAFVRKVMESNPDASRGEMLEVMKLAARNFVTWIVDGELQSPPPTGEGEWSMQEALGCMESFHVLEALPNRWSQYHLFKCNCSEFFKNASCVHSVLAGMVCDPTIKIPSKYLGITLQQRRRRGRPSKRGSEVGDMGEARARIRIQLQREYVAPKVRIS